MLNVFPPFSIENTGYLRLGHPVLAGKFRLVDRPLNGSYFNNLVSSQFCAIPASKILRMGNALQMFKVYAGAVVTQMVNMGSRRSRAIRAFVNEPRRRHCSSAQVHASIPIDANVSLPNMAWSRVSAIHYFMFRGMVAFVSPVVSKIKLGSGGNYIPASTQAGVNLVMHQLIASKQANWRCHGPGRFNVAGPFLCHFTSFDRV